MAGSRERIRKAFAHEEPDRTPLFEIFCGFHPIYWRICGRNPATDSALYWDALAEGITWQELAELTAQAVFAIHKFFGCDMVRHGRNAVGELRRPVKTGPHSWRLGDLDYAYNEKTDLVDPVVPQAYSSRLDEDEVRRQIETWEPTEYVPPPDEAFTVKRRVTEMADAEGLDWVWLEENGAGTGVAFWPPFQLMWLVTDPDLVRRWLVMQKSRALPATADVIRRGYGVVAMGGDVSCDKGPFLSPRHYREFILPVVQEHIAVIHAGGAQAVYTSDGNHWQIAEDFFFNSGADGYKEVDQAAGMTWPRLIEAGVDRRLCILGNLDARYTLCLGTPEQVKQEVRECLDYGRQSPGGHILHASHSVHEDVRVVNYYAAVEAYREYFGLEPLPE
jgi:hypothetical protein